MQKPLLLIAYVQPGYEQFPDSLILDGTLRLGGDGRVVYSGTWGRRDGGGTARHHGRGGPTPPPKFRLKSQDAFRAPSPPKEGGDDDGDGDEDGAFLIK